jgi:hypothetical protein
MRTFPKSGTSYFEFQLEGEEQVYKIPLAADMPMTVLNDMCEASNTGDRFMSQVEMLRKYMGDVVDELSAGTLSDILRAWSDESTQAGASVGES